MKQLFLLTVAVVFSLFTNDVTAQNLDNPVAYMNAVSNAHVEMNKKYMAYMSASAHSSRRRKIDRMRIQALESINTALNITNDLPYYKSDNTLRKSSLDYIKICYNVFNDDYSKIVNMEDIAEQSYDEMEAFILLQEKTDEKIKQAAQLMNDASHAFAAKYNVTLIESSDELDNKLDEAGKLNQYRNKIYLIFFKCNWQNTELSKALKDGKLTVAEQSRTSLIRYADEGMAILDTLKSFAGDQSLNRSCKSVLTFYKKTATADVPKQMDYFLKKENFDRIKRAYDAKSNPTQADVNTFNAAVNELNNASNAYNLVSKNIYNGETEALKNWNQTEKDFAEAHMPYYK